MFYTKKIATIQTIYYCCLQSIYLIYNFLANIYSITPSISLIKCTCTSFRKIYMINLDNNSFLMMFDYYLLKK